MGGTGSVGCFNLEARESSKQHMFKGGINRYLVFLAQFEGLKTNSDHFIPKTSPSSHFPSHFDDCESSTSPSIALRRVVVVHRHHTRNAYGYEEKPMPLSP